MNVSSIHSYIHCAAHSVNTHTDTLSVCPKTHLVHVKKRHAKRLRNLTRTQCVIITLLRDADMRFAATFAHTAGQKVDLCLLPTHFFEDRDAVDIIERKGAMTRAQHGC